MLAAKASKSLRSSFAGIGRIRQDGDVEIAVRAMGAPGTGAEKDQDGDAGQVAGSPQDLFVEGRHEGDRSRKPGLSRAVQLSSREGLRGN